MDFFREGKADVVIKAAKVLDFVCIAWLLVAKLIARAGQYAKSLLLVLLIQAFKFAVLRRETTVTRRIYDQHHLAAKLLQRQVFAIKGLEVKRINVIHGISGHL